MELTKTNSYEPVLFDLYIFINNLSGLHGIYRYEGVAHVDLIPRLVTEAI